MVLFVKQDGMGRRANWLSSPVYSLGSNSNPVLSGSTSFALPQLSHSPGTLLLQQAPPFQKTILASLTSAVSRLHLFPSFHPIIAQLTSKRPPNDPHARAVRLPHSGLGLQGARYRRVPPRSKSPKLSSGKTI